MTPHQKPHLFSKRTQTEKPSKWSTFAWLVMGLLATLTFVVTSQSLASRVNTVMTGVLGNMDLYLPLVTYQGPYTPTSDTTLDGGNYVFSELTIPEGITVTITGDVFIRVKGSTDIAGVMVADCYNIEIRGTETFTLGGFLSNDCSSPSEDAPGIKIVAEGLITIGSEISTEDALVSAGEVFISDPAMEYESTDLIYDVEDEGRLIFENRQPPAFQGNGVNINKPIRAKSGKELRVTNNGNITVKANLTSEKGNDAPVTTAGGNCDSSNMVGGNGGRVSIWSNTGGVTIANGVTIKAGDGGKGGSCNAPSGCPATAIAGPGGRGGSIGFGVETDLVFEAGVTLIRGNGGPGGDATATADHGAGPCANGCDAIASGGMGGPMGGIGYIGAAQLNVVGNPTEDGANGGTGGLATSTGGNGQDCDQCPGGAGGDGGNATSVGGKGGDGGSGNIWQMAANSHLKGNGGMATANGGLGGDGADCCGPNKLGPHLPGGDGGKGGDATATGGQIGDKGKGGNGTRGATAGQGGNGGDGGDGAPPGGPGGKGIGTGDPVDIPDGVEGAPGGPCPVPVIWFIYHSSIPDGAILPGTVITLSTYITPSIETDPTGNVPLLFMPPEDLGYPPNYNKSGNLLQVVGGLRYDLLPILDGFPVIGADVSLNHTCTNPGCIQVLGFSGGDIVGSAQNQQIWAGGPPVFEQILLPLPPDGMLYDGFAIVLTQPTAFFIFDHWWIIIIDP